MGVEERLIEMERKVGILFTMVEGLTSGVNLQNTALIKQNEVLGNHNEILKTLNKCAGCCDAKDS